MGDNHGGAAAAVPAFPVAPYVLLISYLALVLVPFADLLDVLACLHVVKLTSAYLLLTSVIKLTRKLPNILTIKRPYFIRQFSPADFAVALKPSPFTASHFKRWQNKTLLWLTTMGVQGFAAGTPIGPLTP
jgi:chromate transport protein ChrA